MTWNTCLDYCILLGGFSNMRLGRWSLSRKLSGEQAIFLYFYRLQYVFSIKM